MININLNDKIIVLNSVSSRQEKILNKLNIFTINDLLECYPKKIVENHLTKVLFDNLKQTIRVKIISQVTGIYLPRGLHKISFKAQINNQEINCLIFNRSYMVKYLNVNSIVYLIGKFNPKNNTFICQNIEFHHEEIITNYNISGISDQMMKKIMREALNKYSLLIQDFLPVEFINNYKLMTKDEAYKAIHLPTTYENYHQFLRRMKYEELLIYQLKVQYARKLIKSRVNAIKVSYAEAYLKKIINKLPYQLTHDQVSALKDILHDLNSFYPMNRLLEGDVGCGKTIVTILSSLVVTEDHYQVAVMAPTEILAKQHYNSFKEFYKESDLVLLTSGLKKQQRNKALEKIASGQAKVIIGTHALFSDEVIYANLGYVITDEQHRFGVNQRKKLNDKGKNVNVLHLSATPIPRTLAITFFGDMDISQIKTMPKNRKPIITKLINKQNMDKVHVFIREILSKNEQVYIICPLIVDSEKSDFENAKSVYNEFNKIYKDNVLLLHGKLKETEKDQVFKAFQKKEKNILVTTTVVEVGVDVKDATLIVILDADRFGLSQLHQLRGRVGRSSLQSYCLLVSNSKNKETIERLKVIEKTNDGFVVAKMDLQLRGPGELFGLKQSGNLRFKFASLKDDLNILDVAANDAKKIMKNDQKIVYKDILEKIKSTGENYENSI